MTERSVSFYFEMTLPSQSHSRVVSQTPFCRFLKNSFALLFLKLALSCQGHSHVDVEGPHIPHRLYSLELEQLVQKFATWYLGHYHLGKESDS